MPPNTRSQRSGSHRHRRHGVRCCCPDRPIDRSDTESGSSCSSRRPRCGRGVAAHRAGLSPAWSAGRERIRPTRPRASYGPAFSFFASPPKTRPLMTSPMYSTRLELRRLRSRFWSQVIPHRNVERTEYVQHRSRISFCRQLENPALAGAKAGFSTSSPFKDRAFPPMSSRTVPYRQNNVHNFSVQYANPSLPRPGSARRHRAEAAAREKKSRRPARPRLIEAIPHAVDVPCWRIWNVPVAHALRRLHQKPEGE